MEMNFPIGMNVLDTEAQQGPVGKPLDRVDGHLKVTGGARYAYEAEQGPATTYGYIVEASIAKGRIKTIDTSAAERAPGVVLVLTYRNVPAQGTGTHPVAHPVMTGPEVAHYGEPVAFVVAETFEQARAAAYLVKVIYDQARGTYALHDGLKQAHTPEQAPGAPPPDSAVGDFAPAFAAAPVQVDVTYTTPLQSHAMMEPHATLAMWDGDKLTLHTANQSLNQGQHAVATTLKMPVENVRLISPFIGGGFGGKLWVNADAILSAIAARQLKRPVKTALTRQQVFHITTHRSDTIQRVRLGRRSGRPHPGDRSRCHLGQPADRTAIRGRGHADPDAVRRRQPADPASAGTVGCSGRFLDACARRVGGAPGSGRGDGRARREAQSRSDRTAGA